MTYTFKLARRLAVSRHSAWLATVVLLAACADDSTAPEESAPHTNSTPVLLRIVPRVVTVETNQRIRFRGEGTTARGDVVAAAIAWEASGGVIRRDGTFSSATIGTFKVVGRGRGWKKADTSVVVVVPPQPDLTDITIDPGSATLEQGATQAFTATGHLSDGTTKAVGVTWTGTGGSIDPDGSYQAGNTAGSFRVIAANTDGTIADTAAITVNAPPAPPESPPPPTLAKVILTPASASLNTGGTQRFAAYGRDSNGDSVSVSATFTATGGSITSAGLYTAGSNGGTFRVIAAASGKADTSAVTLAAPEPPSSTPPPVGSGISFGSFHLPKEQYGVRGTSGALKPLFPSSASTELAAAKAKGMRIVASLPDSRAHYTNSDGTFNLTKWKSQMDKWKPYASLLKQYYDNGTIVLNYLVDEPNCLQCWGGQSIPHSTLQEMTRYSKQMLPFLPTVIRVTPGWLRTSSSSWPYLDAAWAQTEGPRHTPSHGLTPEEFRDKSVADAKAIGVALVLGMNTINGGDGSSRISGTYAVDPDLSDAPSDRYRYQMSAAEYERAGKAFAAEPYACALISWRYSPTMTTYPQYAQQFDLRSDVQSAAVRIASVAANRSTKSCRKPAA